jgi:DNA-directed RNA polymerase subunit N (RpoN/RPB10)
MSKITRKKKMKNFVTLDCTVMRDENLSWQAKGLHTYLMQLPDDWDIYLKDLQNRSTNGRDSTANILNELITEGYVCRNRVTEKGKFVGFDYEIYEQKVVEIQKTENGFSEYGKTEYGKTEYGKADTINRLKETKINSINKLKESSSNDVAEKEEKKEEIFSQKSLNTERTNGVLEEKKEEEKENFTPGAAAANISDEEKTFAEIKTWIKNNSEKWEQMKEASKLIGLKREDVRAINNLLAQLSKLR